MAPETPSKHDTHELPLEQRGIDVPVSLGRIPDVVGSAATTAQTNIVPRGFYVGAKILPDGTLDTSRAVLLEIPIKPKEQMTLYEIIQSAKAQGINKQQLLNLSQTLGAHNKPSDRQIILNQRISELGLKISRDELLQLARTYGKERVKAAELGPKYHYHQTGFDNLGSIIDSGGLLSRDEQTRRGSLNRKTGTRPDVVQMSRDRYDSSGNLLEPGVRLSASGIGMLESNLVIVLDESIMDETNYDCLDIYPNIPIAPLSKVKYLLVNDETELKQVHDVMAQKGIKINVMLRTDWLENYKN